MEGMPICCMKSSELVVMMQGLVLPSASRRSQMASAPPTLNQLSMVSPLGGNSCTRRGIAMRPVGMGAMYHASMRSRS